MNQPISPDELLTKLTRRPVLAILADELDLTEDQLRKSINSVRDDLKPSTRTSTGSLTLRVDGAARENPGPAGGGAVLFDENDEILGKESEYFGNSLTNNEAEYRALLLGLSLVPQRAQSIKLQMDSELVIKQLRNEYQIKSENLKPYFERARRRLEEIESVYFEHIPREENTRADELANDAIDRHQDRESAG